MLERYLTNDHASSVRDEWMRVGHWWKETEALGEKYFQFLFATRSSFHKGEELTYSMCQVHSISLWACPCDLDTVLV